MMRNRIFLSSAVGLAVMAILSFPVSCASLRRDPPELAPYMSSLQTYSQKLGYAIQAKNKRLGDFYLHEIKEVLEEVKEKVPEHDDMPPADLAQIIADPEIEQLEADLAAGDWPKVETQYRAMIDSCNRCHSAMEHDFLIMTPAQDRPPFNQRFEPP